MSKKQLTTKNKIKERTGTKIIADGFGRKHEHVVRLVKKYQKEFEKIGHLKTSATSGKTKSFKEYYLNNKQVLLLISLLKGTEKVISLKRKAIQAGTLTAILEAIDNFDFGETDIKYVYAAMDSQKRIKIGISNNPEKRIKNLNIGNADKLKLVMVKKAEKPKYQSETELHKNFKAYKIRSEWFSSDILDLLDVEKHCVTKKITEMHGKSEVIDKALISNIKEK